MTTLTNLNALRVARGMLELKSWKNGQAKLLQAIAKLSSTESPGDLPEVAAILATEIPANDIAVRETETETETETEKAPRGAIGVLVMELLQTEMPYEDIVKQVRDTYPSAKTTARSIASVAMDLRADGLTIPSRRKVAKAKDERPMAVRIAETNQH